MGGMKAAGIVKYLGNTIKVLLSHKTMDFCFCRETAEAFCLD